MPPLHGFDTIYMYAVTCIFVKNILTECLYPKLYILAWLCGHQNLGKNEIARKMQHSAISHITDRLHVPYFLHICICFAGIPFLGDSLDRIENILNHNGLNDKH